MSDRFECAVCEYRKPDTERRYIPDTDGAVCLHCLGEWLSNEKSL